MNERHLKPMHPDSVGVSACRALKEETIITFSFTFRLLPISCSLETYDTTHHLSTSQIITVNFSCCPNCSQMRCPFSIRLIPNMFKTLEINPMFQIFHMDIFVTLKSAPPPPEFPKVGAQVLHYCSLFCVRTYTQC